jgi:hypothetical protein
VLTEVGVRTELRLLLPLPQSAIDSRKRACVWSSDGLYISDGTISVALVMKYSVALEPPPYRSTKLGVKRAETLKILSNRKTLTDSKSLARRSKNIALGIKPCKDDDQHRGICIYINPKTHPVENMSCSGFYSLVPPLRMAVDEPNIHFFVNWILWGQSPRTPRDFDERLGK